MHMPEITVDQISFRTDEGAELSGTMYRPRAPIRVVVIAGATGVPEGFYTRFATWLAEEKNMA